MRFAHLDLRRHVDEAAQERIALFAGSYHGSSDLVLAQRDLTGDHGESVPLAPGITEGVSRDVLVLPYGDEASLDALRDRAHELAAVLVEPVQSRRPDLRPRAFLRRLATADDVADAGILLASPLARAVTGTCLQAGCGEFHR